MNAVRTLLSYLSAKLLEPSPHPVLRHSGRRTVRLSAVFLSQLDGQTALYPVADHSRIGVHVLRLATFLAAIPADLDIPADLPAIPDEPATSLPFFEAYFSNFIEGTEFSVEAAEAIVASGEIPAERPEDAHDVLGTFEAVADPELRAAVPDTSDELFALLERRHRLVMGGRPDQRPGRFKDKANQAGSYVFVAPALVEGTLIEGFRRLVDLPPGFSPAMFELFVISEVHPYDDGNGRVARAAMCAELTAGGQARIVVPIVFRNEYQTALRNLSREGRCDLYVRTLAHAWRWTAGMPWQDRAAVDGYLVATNALTDSTDAERSILRLELPSPRPRRLRPFRSLVRNAPWR
ncbi:MAG TPA: Fic family protein [Acidimicrobiales bacterium]|nr:Fic family protein [Acidimicrobiales bacterium]